MSDNKTSGIGTSNETFISFVFAVVSVVMIVLYIPWIINIIRETVAYYQAPKKLRSEMHNPLEGLYKSCIYIPGLICFFAKEPALLVEGFNVSMKEKKYFFSKLLPKFLKFVLRPRVFLPVLWVSLLFAAMYATLTFDPHAILGIPRSSSTAEVKKAYRSLARRYHPDHNSTDEARVLFTQVRRAYKALVDQEAFEEEEMKNTQDYSVGVALPHFLVSREHDGLVLFGLLGLLFGLPIFIWYKMTNDNKIEKLINCINTDKERTEHFIKHFGIPEDTKYVERRISRRFILGELIKLGICPPNVSDHVVEKFPPLPDFIQRCVDAEHQKTFLNQLGFNESGIVTLQAHMVANGLSLLEQYESQVAILHKNQEVEPEEKLISPSAYKATKYLYQLHTSEVDQALKELVQINDSLPSAKKLLRLHEEIYDNLEYLYAKGVKKNKNALSQLVQTPQRVSELVHGVEQELMMAYRRLYKSEMERSVSKQQLRAYKKQMNY